MKKPPIFIIGCPRSGTTLLRVILDSHPNICCGPETHLISKLKEFNDKIGEYWKMLEIFGLERSKQLEKLSEIFNIFPEKYMINKNKIRWAEKTPDNIFYAFFIKELFPKCQFINVIRDGRDVVNSHKKRWGRRTILKGIKKWNMSMKLTFQFRKKFCKEDYLEIRYETLVSNPETETKKIMEFLNEPWNPILLEHNKQQHDFWFNIKTGKNIDIKSEKKPKRHSPSRPIFSSSVGKWKKELNILEKIIIKLFLQDNLKKMGYL
jgi:hypothetical protein